MRIHIPGALRSYTEQQSEVELGGATLANVLTALDQRFPGIRFRIITEQDAIRPHIRIFINDRQTFYLAEPLHDDDDVYIVCALSGG
ncbi:MAG TPA: molybdopterin synthase sulfur carrier subunit [Nitrospira sp.]|nr:molybdopterin synthase sulfur carrier subunit [Nitrospira sp.]HBR49068.1 molybdopterin synthase sulfur carrier subunit [Nitrospira sp.]